VDDESGEFMERAELAYIGNNQGTANKSSTHYVTAVTKQ